MTCGILILLGIFNRVASIPLLINISMAIFSTKIPILIGHGNWLFSPPPLAKLGFWSMAHEARTDVSMLPGLLFLPDVGTGMWSFDAQCRARLKNNDSTERNSI